MRCGEEREEKIERIVMMETLTKKLMVTFVRHMGYISATYQVLTAPSVESQQVALV